MAIRKRGRVEEKVLDVDASMQGTMTFKDPVNLKINGRFEGSLDTKGSLTIGEQAQVDAKIKGEDVTISGRVSGDVKASRSLKLTSSAQVTGDITMPLLSIDKGAVLEGSCHMLKAPKHVAISDNKDNLEKDRLEIEDVAHYLEVDRPIVEQWAKEGRIPAEKKGNKWTFQRSKIEEWVVSERTA